jgi:hypothetical protein
LIDANIKSTEILSDDLARYSKDVRIRQISLFTKFGEVTLSHIFEEVQIYESIFNNTLTGSISLIDSRNVPELFELKGGERIRISYKSAGYPDYLDLDFFMYKISERYITKDRTTAYVLYFASKEFIRNEMVKVSKYFSNQPHNIVKDILSSNLYGLDVKDKPIETEQCRDFVNCIPALWSPFKTLNWIARRSISALYTGSPYVLFETKEKFVFSSIANLLASPSKKTLVYSPKIREGAEVNIIEDSLKVESYNIESSLDFISRLHDGGISSKIITFNLYDKSYKELGFNYGDTQSNNSTIFEGLDYKKQYSTHIQNTIKHDFMYESDINADQVGGNSSAEIWQIQRASNLTNTSLVTLNLSIAGDSDLNAGQVIQFNIPSPSSNTTGERRLDSELSGRYLITDIGHKITRDYYEMNVKISKDNNYQPLKAKSLYAENSTSS